MLTLQELREKHQKLTQPKVKGEAKETNGSFLTLDDGDNWVRILPGKEDPLNFYVEGGVHKFKDTEGKDRSYHCRKVHGESCPLCDFYFDLWKMHKELNLPKGVKSKYGNMATAIKLKPRYNIKVVSRALEAKGEDPVKFLSLSEQAFTKITAAVSNPDLTDDEDPNTTILSLERGNDFNVRITKKSDGNKSYPSFEESCPKIKKTKASSDPTAVRAWMESPLDLKSLVKLETYEDGKKIAMDLLASLNTVKTESKAAVSNSSSEESDDGDSKFREGLKA
jgi:hypothetical protein